MYPAQTDSRATMVRMILLACLLIPESVGSGPFGSDPVGAVSVTDNTKDTAYIMYKVEHCVHALTLCSLSVTCTAWTTTNHSNTMQICMFCKQIYMHANHKARTCSPMQDY